MCTPVPSTAAEFEAVLDASPELAGGLRRGDPAALTAYFQLGGGTISSITVRSLDERPRD